MALEVAVIVADTPPLITLAAAQRLDYLLYPALPVIIPDAVFYEATGQIDRLGAIFGVSTIQKSETQSAPLSSERISGRSDELAGRRPFQVGKAPEYARPGLDLDGGRSGNWPAGIFPSSRE